VTVAPAPVAPAFAGTTADFPSTWTALPGEAPSPTAAREASDLAHVTVGAFDYPQFTTTPSDPLAAFSIPIWHVGSSADASTLADALVARDRAGFPVTGAYLVLPDAVVDVPTRVEADVTAHLATRGVVVSRSVWPCVGTDPGMFPAAWQQASVVDHDSDSDEAHEASTQVSAIVLGISERHYTGASSGAFVATYYSFASLDDAASAAAFFAFGAGDSASAVRYGPASVVVLPMAHVNELEELYGAHGLVLQAPASEG
jgi:hypothetical protein